MREGRQGGKRKISRRKLTVHLKCKLKATQTHSLRLRVKSKSLVKEYPFESPDPVL